MGALTELWIEPVRTVTPREVKTSCSHVGFPRRNVCFQWRFYTSNTLSNINQQTDQNMRVNLESFSLSICHSRKHIARGENSHQTRKQKFNDIKTMLSNELMLSLTWNKRRELWRNVDSHSQLRNRVLKFTAVFLRWISTTLLLIVGTPRHCCCLFGRLLLPEGWRRSGRK